MKKYFIAVAALAFLAACNGKAAKDTPVLVEEESIAVAEAAPDAPSLPELPVDINSKLSTITVLSVVLTD